VEINSKSRFLIKSYIVMTILIEEEVKCIKCEEEIPPKRLEILPGTKTCVKCSTVGAYSGRPILHGKGEDTYVEIDIMTPEQAKKISAILDKGKDKKTKKMEWNGKDSDSHIKKPTKKTAKDIPTKD
tara:strand:- start:1251 stop:1631 length:381 start_codon:yes stop_codon:yes gene_type:complete